MNTYTLSAPGITRSVWLARHWLAIVLASQHPHPPQSVRDNALLALSECVTNALTHTHSGHPEAIVRIHARLTYTSLEVQVEDLGGATTPQTMAASTGPEREHGYGLFLVDQLTDTWGTLSGRSEAPQLHGVFFRLTWPARS